MKKALWCLVYFITLCAHSGPEPGRLVLKIDIELILNALPRMDHINDFSVSLLQGILSNMGRILEPYRLLLAQSFFELPEPEAGEFPQLTFTQSIKATPPENLIGEQIPVLLPLYSPETIHLHFEMALLILVTPAHSGYNPTISIPVLDERQSINIPSAQINQFSGQLILCIQQILNSHGFQLAVIVIMFLLSLIGPAS